MAQKTPSSRGDTFPSLRTTHRFHLTWLPILFLLVTVLVVFAMRMRPFVSMSLNNLGFLRLNAASKVLVDPPQQGLDSAATQFEQAMKIQPGNDHAGRGLGVTLAFAGKREVAQPYLLAAGVGAREFSFLGDTFRRNRLYSEAIYWYEQAAETNPENAENWHKIGSVYEMMEDPANAIRNYRTSWQIAPEFSAKSLALLLQRENDLAEMESLLRQTLDVVPQAADRPWWWYGLGESLRLQNRFEEAEKLLLAGLEEFPTDPLLLISLGWVYYEQHDDVIQAQSTFEQAREFDPTGRAEFSIGEMLVREQQLAEADPWFALALAENPNNPRWYIVRTNTARLAGDLELALQMALETIARFPNYAPGYYQAAIVYRAQGNVGSSAEAIGQALQRMSLPNVNYYVTAGEIYEWTGDVSQAIWAFEQAISLVPDHQPALTALNRLQADQ